MATALSDDDDHFDFEMEERIEALKVKILSDIETHCLQVAVQKVVPIDLMAIFELKSAEQTIDRCEELRREVSSFIEIAFDSMQY